MILKGLKVIDFCSYIAGPGTAGILSDWGADVIKVERPEGDNMRHILKDLPTDVGANPAFDLDNRGKRSVVIDITKPSGRDVLERLAGSADIFLTNVRPAVLKRVGLDYASLGQAYPKLIYGLITGYGLDGPDADKPGFDVTAFWARGAAASMTIPKGAEPFLLRSGVGDHTTSLSMAAALLAALYERARTDRGRLVATSLLAAAVYVMGSDLAVQMRFGRLVSARPRTNPLDALANFYRSQEGRWFVHNPRDSRAWRPFALVAGRADLIDDERFATGRARRVNAQALTVELEAAFLKLPFDEIARRLDEADLVWAPMQTAAEIVQDPQAIAAGCFVEVEDGAGGQFRAPAAPAQFPGADAERRPAAPKLGQHTETILSEAGYTAQEIVDLMSEAAVAGVTESGT